MTLNGWLQIALYCALVLVCVKPLGAFMAAALRRRADLSSPRARAGRARLLPPGRRRSQRASRTGDLYGRDAGLQRGGLLRSLRAAAAAGRAARSTRRASTRSPSISPSTPRSASSPTRTGSPMAARSTMSYLVADGRADGAELRVGRDRHRARHRADARLRAGGVQDGRQFLGRPDARHALRPAAAVRRDRPGAASPLACRRHLGAYVDATTLEGAQQTIAHGPVASQIAIKQLGTNGGGFFNANSAHPFENPTAISQPDRDVGDLRDRRGADLHVRAHGRRPAPGLGPSRRR